MIDLNGKRALVTRVERHGAAIARWPRTVPMSRLPISARRRRRSQSHREYAQSLSRLTVLIQTRFAPSAMPSRRLVASIFSSMAGSPLRERRRS